MCQGVVTQALQSGGKKQLKIITMMKSFLKDMQDNLGGLWTLLQTFIY